MIGYYLKRASCAGLYWAHSLVVQAPQLVRIVRDTRRPSVERRRELRRVLSATLRPEWLTNRVSPIAEIRRRALACDSVSYAERFHRLLHGCHSLRSSVAIAITVVSIAVGASLLGGLLLSKNWPATPPSAVGTGLLTTAEVLGGIAGLLFAALVFGVQFHGERLGHASFLVRFLARREGMVPIAAFTLAVIAANLFVGLVTMRTVAPAAVVLAMIDAVLVPVVFLLTVWLIYRLVAVTSGDFFEQSLKPGLAWEYQRGLDEELHRAQLLRAYEELLETAKLEHGIAAGHGLVRHGSTIVFGLHRQGTIRDVNVGELRALGELIERECPEYVACLSVAPYDRVDDRPVLILSTRRDPDGGRTSAQPIAEATRVHIEQTLQRIFVFGPARDREVVDLLRRFQDTVISYARYDRPDQLKRALDVYRHLIEQRLQRGIRESGPVSLSFNQLPDFLRGAGYSDLAEGTVNSDDREKVEIVLMFAVRVMQLGIKHRHIDMLRSAARLIETIYGLGHKRASFQPWLGRTLDMWIHHVLEGFHVRRIPLGDELDVARADAELPLLKVVLAWVITLIKIAIEADLREDAEDFHSRVFLFDRHLDLRRSWNVGESRPSALTAALDLHTYVMVVLAGWCLFLARNCSQHTEALKAVFRRSIADCATQHDLVRTWENVNRLDATQTPIDTQLGVETWHEPDRRWRSGIPEPVVIARSWVPDGFVALGMVRPAARKHGSPDDLPDPPSVAYDAAAIEETANALIQDEYVRNELLSLDESTAQKTRDQFVDLIRKRVCAARRADLTRLVGAPLSKEREADIRRQVEAHVDEHRAMLHLVEKLGGLRDCAVASLYPPTRLLIHDWKTNFVDSEQGASNHGEFLAKMIAEREDIRIIYEAERSASIVRTVSDLAQLADAVRSAMHQLREDYGFEPSVILAPSLPHAMKALCGKNWFASVNGIDRVTIAKFEKIPVIKYPYVGAESVTIVDVGEFFGKARFAPGATAVSLTVEDRFASDNQALVAVAQHETEPSKIAEKHALRVGVRVTVLVGAGVREPRAAVRVQLDPRGLGYAFREPDQHYHRPDCTELVGAPNVEFSLNSQIAAKQGGREPCPSCKPDQWSYDG